MVVEPVRNCLIVEYRLVMRCYYFLFVRKSDSLSFASPEMFLPFLNPKKIFAHTHA